MKLNLLMKRSTVLRLGFSFLFAISLLSCFAVTPISGQQTTGYDLNVDNSVPTSTQSITIDRPGFGTYQIDSLGLYESGTPVTASVTTPNGTDPTNLEFQLFAQGGRLVADKTPDNTGKATFTGSTMGLSPGTYQLVIFSPSEAKALKPIVISGYDISVTNPEEVDQNSELTVRGTVSETKASQPPASVKVILWNDAYDKRVNADFDGQAFSANISLADLSPGEYNLYVTANGNKQYQGEDEIKAIEEGGSVTITEDTGDGESGDGESGDGESGDGESGDGESGDGESGDGESGDGESGDGGVIEPSSSDGESTTSDSTTTDDQTDLGVSLVVLALLLVTLLLRSKKL